MGMLDALIDPLPGSTKEKLLGLISPHHQLPFPLAALICLRPRQNRRPLSILAAFVDILVLNGHHSNHYSPFRPLLSCLLQKLMQVVYMHRAQSRHITCSGINMFGCIFPSSSSTLCSILLLYRIFPSDLYISVYVLVARTWLPIDQCCEERARETFPVTLRPLAVRSSKGELEASNSASAKSASYIARPTAITVCLAASNLRPLL